MMLKANGCARFAPVQPIVAEQLDLQTQQAQHRAGARGHDAARDVEPAGADLEIESGEQRHEPRMTRP